MTRFDAIGCARAVLAGERAADSFLYGILESGADRLSEILFATDFLRRARFGNRVRLCTITNGKSGRCSEDCRFCSQSAHGSADVPVYDLLPAETLREGALFAASHGVDRYSIVTSGRGMKEGDLTLLCDAVSGFPKGSTRYCASLGIQSVADMERLKAAGVSRYHHNLETAKSLFSRICTTHTYEERIATIAAAKKAGLSVCSGGIFGLGETNPQVVEMAKTLRDLKVDAVPMNFLVPIAGTPMAAQPPLTALRCLQLICVFRFVLPKTDLIICGGRSQNLRSLQPLAFTAGATGLMTGDYLTTPGSALQGDLAMLADGGWEPVTGACGSM